MKPDWKDAPEWANYLVMDEDGAWGWYEEEPTRNITCWSGPYPYTSRVEPAILENWKDSLEKRPDEN